VVAALALVAATAASAAAAVSNEDAFVKGYAAAVLEREFRVVPPSLRVDNGVIYVDPGELGAADRDAVVAALRSVRGAARVELLATGQPPPAPPVVPAPPPPGPTASQPLRVLSEWQTGLLPGGTLFKPLLADPRWPHFAAAYHRYVRDPQLRDIGTVSFGETFSLYRDRVGGGWWEVGVQAGVFAFFDLASDSADLVNADYLVGVPLSLRHDDFSLMFRLFHQSSHLGDEFLLRTRPNRINLSYEAVDLKASYDFWDVARLYGGAGYLFHREPSNLDPWSIQYGLELTSPWPDRGQRWRPIAGIDVQHREENDWSSDVSVRAGVQIDGVLATRSMQLLLEWFRGRSPNGQFYKEKIEYFGLGAHFHF